MKTQKMKKFLPLVAAVATVSCGLIFASCSSVDSVAVDNHPSSTENTLPDAIVIAMESEPPTLHPFDHKSVTASYMNELTFDTLFIPNMVDLSPEPRLLSGYETLSDTLWKFTVREDVYFHDGSLMTPEDVVASMEYAKTNLNTSDFTSFWKSVTVEEDGTILLETFAPCGDTLSYLCNIEVVPKALIDAGHDFSKSPIGTGPYIFVSQTLGDEIVFTKNEAYFDNERMPTITEMTWKIIPEGSSRTIALEAGEVDLLIEVESADLSRLQENPETSIAQVEGTRHTFLTMNNEVAPFDNEDFRKALNAAVDRDNVLLVAENGVGTPSIAQAPSCFAGFTEENAIGYDLEQAKAFLATSGIVDAEFDCIVYNDVNRRIAEVLQADFAEIGVTMNISSMDLATFLTQMLGGDYDVAVAGYTSSTMQVYLQGLFHSSSIGASNSARLVIPEFDQMIEEAQTILIPQERVALYQGFIAKVNDLAPFVPLYDNVVTRAYNSKLGGVEISPTGRILYSTLYWVAD